MNEKYAVLEGRSRKVYILDEHIQTDILGEETVIYTVRLHEKSGPKHEIPASNVFDTRQQAQASSRWRSHSDLS